MKQIVTFNLLNEEMGLDISCVHEIVKPQEIHPLPKAPDFIEGVINLRGRIIAVIDLRKKFGIKAAEDRSKIHIIICKIKKFVIGLIVDGINEVVTLAEQDIQPEPEVVSIQIKDDYVSGIARLGERIIMILNLEEILTEHDATKLAAI